MIRRSPVRAALAVAGVVATAVLLVLVGPVGDRSLEQTSSGPAAAPPSPSVPDTGAPSTGAAVSTAPSVPAPAPQPLVGRTIVLDPGHNRDNGEHAVETGRLVDAGGFSKACNTTGAATEQGVAESAVNWAVAVALRERLERLGASVQLTRQADAGWGPCIDERAAVANRAAADVLLSLHADGAAPRAHGFHIITPGEGPSGSLDRVGRSAAVAVVLRDALVDAGFVPATYLGVRGIDVRTDLGTLNRAEVPAVMLEAGNLRHAGDARLLTSPAGQEALAAALTQGLLATLAADAPAVRQ